MKNVDNALSGVVDSYGNSLSYNIVQYLPEDHLWTVNVHNRNVPGSLLQIEIIDDKGIPKCCVLQKINVGRRSMFQFMNRLVDALE
jgi:hypothetical protein